MRGSMVLRIAASSLFTAVALSGAVIQDVSLTAVDIPSGGTSTILFRLSQPASTRAIVLNSDLHIVKSYDLGNLGVGQHMARWDTTDTTGNAVGPEAYTWRIEARTNGGVDVWEPAGLYSRPMEHITDSQWDPEARTISYRISVPMRIWLRIGFAMGAGMRVLADGEPRPAGVILESWDGLDESGQIGLLDRKDTVVGLYGYRLPVPCVIVSGGVSASSPRDRFEMSSFAAHLKPAVLAADPFWTRLRGFVVGHRQRPELRIEQLSQDTFAASLTIPPSLRDLAADILQNTIGDRVRLKWYIDGYCASEDVDAALPSLLTLYPDQIPRDGARHFITANLFTVNHQCLVTSKWIEIGEE